MKKVTFTSVLPYFIIVFLSFYSCNQASKKQIIDLKNVKEEKITATVVSFDKEPMYPKGCMLIDSILVLYEPKLKEGFLSIYDIKSNKLLNKFGNIGNGPCDFSRVRFLQNFKTGKDFLLGDSKNIYRLNIDSLLVNYKNCENTILQRIPQDLKRYNYILGVKENTIIANTTGENQLVIFNKKDKSQVYKKYYKKEVSLENINDFCYATQIYDAYYASNNGKNIVIAYENVKRIDIVSADGTLKKEINFPNYDENLSKIKKIDDSNVEIKDGTFFYSYVYPTDNYFYSLCWNSPIDKIGEGKAMPEIQIFNWNGALQKVLKLDRPISYFCIDEKNKIIYAIGITPDFNFKIYKYNFKM